MSQSHVATGQYMTGQKISGVRPAAGLAGPWRASDLGQPDWGDVTTVENPITYHGGELDHVPARLLGPGPNQNTFVLSSN
jgi:hypothetical protein